MLQNKIVLQKCFFTEKEKAFLENGELKVSVFKYSSGIEALTVRNKKGYITVLPYKGQQIWRAGFMGHELVMHSMFNEPTDSDDFLHTYGAFLIHCGPVSYTHLDVYKRQIQRSFIRSSMCRIKLLSVPQFILWNLNV